MPKVFISYRRQDSAAMAGWICDYLQGHFTKDAVFMDLDSIPFGADFRQHIRKAVDQCDVMLALIGQNWVGRSGDARRIDDPRDFVRIEIEVALEREPHLTIIPVLIGRATIPAEADLPPSLAQLAYRNAIEVDHGRDFHPHVDRLIKGIEDVVKGARRGGRASPEWIPRLWICLALVSVLAILGVIIHIRVPGVQREELTNSIGMKLRLIQPDEFLMGSPDTDKDALGSEKPRHRVRITRPFYLGVTEVTRGQFRRFVDETGYKTEAEKDGKGGYRWNEEAKDFEQDARYTWQNAGFEQTDDHPVVNLGWNDALAFAGWLSGKEGQTYLLPTEAEWEYACRAGTITGYSCGDDPEGLAEVGNVLDGTARKKHPDWDGVIAVITAIAAEDGYVYTAPVGRFRANKWGLHDMHGNVWEWCSDNYDEDYYKSSPVDDPTGPPQAMYRVIRGGSWSGRPLVCRSAFRGRYPARSRINYLGFRLARVQ
jgi:formylglycine-generating enzyme required for sulfatase activity